VVSRLVSHLTYANVISTIALFVALGGGAVAAKSFIGSDGQIHGCVSKQGELTLRKPGKSCPKHRKQIAWNQQGPPGADVIARFRGGPVTVPASSSSTPVPISPSTFGQGAGDAILLVGRMSVTPPANCGTTFPFNSVQGQVDGVSIIFASVPLSGARTIYFGTAGIPSGSAARHALSLTASNSCTNAGQGTYTVNSLSIDAVRAR
jgi:hypothetical protein